MKIKLILYIFVLFFYIFFSSCVTDNRKGYLLLRESGSGYDYVLYDVKTHKKYYIDNSFYGGYGDFYPGSILKIFSNDNLIYLGKSIRNKETNNTDSVIKAFDLNNLTIIKEYTILNISCYNFQICKDCIYVMDTKKIIKYEINTSKQMEIYSSNEYISEAFVIEEKNYLFSYEILNLSDFDPRNNEYVIYKIDLANNKKEIFDYGYNPYFSKKYNKIIYCSDYNSVKIYDINEEKTNELMLAAYNRNSAFAFITENLILVNQRRFSWRKIYNTMNMLDSGVYSRFVLYNIETGKKKNLFDYSYYPGGKISIEYIEFDIKKVGFIKKNKK